jgi:ATP-dependent protease ClpP protease subunit
MGGAQGQASDIEITAREIMKLKRNFMRSLLTIQGNSLKESKKIQTAITG